jgi:hypothetical protein
MLDQCAWAAKRKKDSHYHAQFYQISARPRAAENHLCRVWFLGKTPVTSAGITVMAAFPENDGG